MITPQDIKPGARFQTGYSEVVVVMDSRFKFAFVCTQAWTAGLSRTADELARHANNWGWTK